MERYFETSVQAGKITQRYRKHSLISIHSFYEKKKKLEFKLRGICRVHKCHEITTDQYSAYKQYKHLQICINWLWLYSEWRWPSATFHTDGTVMDSIREQQRTMQPLCSWPNIAKGGISKACSKHGGRMISVWKTSDGKKKTNRS